jgi:hypothetical protein
MDQCPLPFEVLLGNACKLGQEVLSMITLFTPLRSQLRLLLSSYQSRFGLVGSLSLRWSRTWTTNRSLGFDFNDSVVKFMKAPGHFEVCFYFFVS